MKIYRWKIVENGFFVFRKMKAVEWMKIERKLNWIPLCKRPTIVTRRFPLFSYRNVDLFKLVIFSIIFHRVDVLEKVEILCEIIFNECCDFRAHKKSTNYFYFARVGWKFELQWKFQVHLTSSVDARWPNSGIIFSCAENLIENLFLFLPEIYSLLCGTVKKNRRRIKNSISNFQLT